MSASENIGEDRVASVGLGCFVWWLTGRVGKEGESNE